MKKKGLIISTVVMVVVLIASLTTATYAWFTVSNKTTISGFNLSVVSGNAVNIGVKANNKHELNAYNDMFLSGQVNWNHGTTEGALGETAGTWTDGTKGLTATLDHQIKWGEQSKAVGAFNAKNHSVETDSNEYGVIGDTPEVIKRGTGFVGKANTVASGDTTYLNAANLGTGTTLANVSPAYANKNKDDSAEQKTGDYAYLFLGAAPAEELTSNSLILMLDGTNSTGTNVGMLAAVHVAYRVTKAGATNVTTKWTEVQFFNVGYRDALQEQNPNLTPEEKKAYETAYTSGSTTAKAPTSKAGVVRIGDLSTAQGAIDQIEIIIYIAGSDPDCIDNAKNASGEIKMFFATTSATPSEKPANPTIDTTGKFSMTGVNGSTVEYRIGDTGEWKSFATAGNWTENTYSVAKVEDKFKGATVYVRQKTVGKGYSEAVKVDNNYPAA